MCPIWLFNKNRLCMLITIHSHINLFLRKIIESDIIMLNNLLYVVIYFIKYILTYVIMTAIFFYLSYGNNAISPIWLHYNSIPNYHKFLVVPPYLPQCIIIKNTKRKSWCQVLSIKIWSPTNEYTRHKIYVSVYKILGIMIAKHWYYDIHV